MDPVARRLANCPSLGGEGLDQARMPVTGVEQEAFLVAVEPGQAAFITASGTTGDGHFCVLSLTSNTALQGGIILYIRN